MASITQRIDAIDNSIKSALALYNGTRDKGFFYTLFGNVSIYGCKITQGFAGSGFTIGLSGDVDNINPDKADMPTEKHNFANIALVYGEGFLMKNLNTVTLDEYTLQVDSQLPSPSYGRYDIVYIYVDYSGPSIAVQTGQSSTACYDDFVANGLELDVYGQSYDPSIPDGTMPLARIYVQDGDTEVVDARIVDLRKFGIDVINSSVYGSFIDATSAYVARSNDLVFCDTLTTGSFTVDLPATPNIGDTVTVHDVKSNFNTANLTIGRNGETIMGLVSNLILNVADSTTKLIYSGTDWRVL